MLCKRIDVVHCFLWQRSVVVLFGFKRLPDPIKKVYGSFREEQGFSAASGLKADLSTEEEDIAKGENVPGPTWDAFRNVEIG